jgi:hypothetical protein
MSDEMPWSELLFRVGMAVGSALTTKPPEPTIPRLEPGQRFVQMWSEPDALGYRYLLTFERVEKGARG